MAHAKMCRLCYSKAIYLLYTIITLYSYLRAECAERVPHCWPTPTLYTYRICTIVHIKYIYIVLETVKMTDAELHSRLSVHTMRDFIHVQLCAYSVTKIAYDPCGVRI